MRVGGTIVMAKTFVGIVSSDRTDKTIVVKVSTRKAHPIYRKQFTSTKKFFAHDAKNEAHIGDKVAISETRPMSARKRFKLSEILERAPVRHVESITPELAEAIGNEPESEEAKEDV